MFQLYPGALDAELDRRHELALATMQAAHGVATLRHERVFPTWPRSATSWSCSRSRSSLPCADSGWAPPYPSVSSIRIVC